MAIIPKALQISTTPFPSTLILSKPRKPLHSLLPPRAIDDDADDNASKQTNQAEPTATTPGPGPDGDFESRLNQVRIKYRSGTGKKAEQRRAKKSGGAGGKKKKGSVMLPPVPLREPVAADGVKVEFGFTQYSERLHGRLAALGLAALLLVEVGSGQGLLKYHSPPILFIQVYTVAASSAMFVKYEKERISIWPEKSSAATGE